MATKLERISRLALETSRSITASPQQWKAFLDSAAWLYKYPFRDQVLIHAQVKLCQPGSLPRSEGKAVRVIDKRKL